jgi:hypothetical protein
MADEILNWTSKGIEGFLNKGAINLLPKDADTSTSLTLTGTGFINYGPIQQENFMYLLENFASNLPPTTPTIGQLWFKPAASTLYVCVDPASVASGTTTYFPLNGLAWTKVGSNAVTIVNSTITSALGYTPYNSTNPNGYTSNAGTVTGITAGTGLAGGNISTSGTISLANIANVAGAYTLPSVTVDGQGRITSISSGSVAQAGNATTAGGLAIGTTANTGINQIVRTDGGGSILSGWISTVSGDNGSAAITRVYASNDNYIRTYSLTNFTAQLTGTAPSLTAGLSNGVNQFPSRTDGVFYQANWNNAVTGDKNLYSSAMVTIRSSGYGAIGFNGGGWYLEGNATYGINSNTGINAAALFDNGNRVYSAINPQPVTSNAVGLGIGQSWINMVGQRAFNVTYTNTTGKPIQISACGTASPNGAPLVMIINGAVVGIQGAAAIQSASVYATLSHVIPNGATYQVQASYSWNNDIMDFGYWYELR